MPINNRNKKILIITVSIPVMILLGVLVYLYFTNHLQYIFDLKLSDFIKSLKSIEKWLLSVSIFAVITLGILTNTISTYISNKLFRTHNKEILINTIEINKKEEKILNNVANLDYKLDRILNKTNIDPRNIEIYLSELPWKGSGIEIKEIINQWYSNSKINLEEKELLYIVLQTLNKQREDLSKESESLKSIGNKELAEILDEINYYIGERNAEKVSDVYFKNKEKLNKENIRILKESINATKTLYAYDETIKLFRELIKLEPTEFNYYNFGIFLKSYESYSEALKCFTILIEHCSEQLENDLKTYLPKMIVAKKEIAEIYLHENDYNKAIDVSNQALQSLKYYEKTYSDLIIPEKAEILYILATTYKYKFEYSKSKSYFDEALVFQKELTKFDSKHFIFLTRIFIGYGILYSKLNELSEAKKNYQEALKICRSHINKDSDVYLILLSTILNNTAIISSGRQALEKQKEAVKIMYLLSTKNPKFYLPQLANHLTNLGRIYLDLNSNKLALEKLEEALKINNDLQKKNHNIYKVELARILYNIADYYVKNKELTKAEEKFEEVYKVRKEIVQNNSMQFNSELIETMNSIAKLYQQKRDFSNAIKKYNEVLNFQKEFSIQNPKKYIPEVAKTYNALGDIFMLKSRYRRAIKYFNLAIITINVLDTNDSQIQSIIGSSKTGLAYSHGKRKDFLKAKQECKQAISIYEKLKKDNSKNYNVKYAKLLAMGIGLRLYDKSYYSEVKSILKKYPNDNEVKEFLTTTNFVEKYDIFIPEN